MGGIAAQVYGANAAGTGFGDLGSILGRCQTERFNREDGHD